MACDFLIFGAAGMQGEIVTRDLVERGFNVFISNRSEDGLDRIRQQHVGVEGETLDLQDAEKTIQLISRIRPHVVVNCAEGDWNLEVYRAALASNAHVIDLGSTIPVTKDQFALHDEFARRDLCAITGCGSTPGVNNISLARACEEFDEVHTVEAGFAWDSNIKQFVVPFSMESIIEEFMDSATVLQGGVWQERVPLETIERRTFHTIGEQRCFLVRHPEVYTFYQYGKDRGLHTIRFFAGFPDHSFDFILPLAHKKTDAGIPVDGEGIVPLSALSRVLERRYPKPPGYTEHENLWVVVEGISAGKPRRTMIECIVPTLLGWESAGCNIDTGFPASIIAQMILNGTITKRGSFAPEMAVPHKEFFTLLGERGMKVFMDGTQIH